MTILPTRILGRSGMPVTALCLGAMNFGGPTPEDEARSIISAAWDDGVRFIDTASNYTRHYVLRTLETSLRRLKTDAIDLLYVHRVDPLTPWDDVVRTFGDLVRSGKIRYWGLSNVRAWQIAHIVHLCRQMNVAEPVALQPYYNLLNRQPEVEVLPAARTFGLGIVTYSPIARGILSGKYQLNVAPEAGSRVARRDKRVMETEWRPESLELADKLKAHAAGRGLSLVAFATAWVLNNKAVSSVIAGPRTLEQWRSYGPALTYAWTAADEAIVNAAVPAGHASTPGYTDPSYPVEGRYPFIN